MGATGYPSRHPEPGCIGCDRRARWACACVEVGLAPSGPWVWHSSPELSGFMPLAVEVGNGQAPLRLSWAPHHRPASPWGVGDGPCGQCHRVTPAWAEQSHPLPLSRQNDGGRWPGQEVALLWRGAGAEWTGPHVVQPANSELRGLWHRPSRGVSWCASAPGGRETLSLPLWVGSFWVPTPFTLCPKPNALLWWLSPPYVSSSSHMRSRCRRQAGLALVGTRCGTERGGLCRAPAWSGAVQDR